mmetsp:Transcript_129908/g.376159  ORF Transcript_129908/g.376159 Transcript_129908/m.376159 type:complete len:197 (-) Transcript_129908:9-599(-)
MLYNFPLLCSIVALLACQSAQSFTPQLAQPSMPVIQKRPRSTTTLGIGNMLENMFGGGGSNNEPKNIVDLPGSTKVGPLRFFLQIYLVAEQNKPFKGAWVVNNNESNESLDVYYKDGTGMFSIELKETGVKIDRYGQKPSLEYMLQESVIMHGILDELNTIAFEVEDVEKEKRLLQLSDDEAINKARETLPARKEG